MSFSRISLEHWRVGHLQALLYRNITITLKESNGIWLCSRLGRKHGSAEAVDTSKCWKQHIIHVLPKLGRKEKRKKLVAAMTATHSNQTLHIKAVLTGADETNSYSAMLMWPSKHMCPQVSLLDRRGCSGVSCVLPVTVSNTVSCEWISTKLNELFRKF